MEEGQQFCPHCQEDRPTFESSGEKQKVVRCQACGYPISEILPKITEPPAEVSGPLVLHVDDDPVLRRLVAGYLTKSGYTPISASDGESGLALAQEGNPVAVLLDIDMPGLDGYEVARKLRALPALKGIAIIMLTGTLDLKVNALAFKAGADMTMRKPLDRQKLLSVLQTALQLKRVRRAL
jgi:CheY-like chemotaxis protein